MRMRSLLCIALSCGCHHDATVGGAPDLAPSFEFDFGAAIGDAGCELNECGDCNAGCTSRSYGPGTGTPFALMGDLPPDPNESDVGVSRDKNGWLGLASYTAQLDL